jgi:hypothetical protein
MGQLLAVFCKTAESTRWTTKAIGLCQMVLFGAIGYFTKNGILQMIFPVIDFIGDIYENYAEGHDYRYKDCCVMKKDFMPLLSIVMGCTIKFIF